MGFFSKCCAKTFLPVMADCGSPDPRYHEVVVLLPDGNTITGDYDGYGRVGSANIYAETDWSKTCFVLKTFYEGESYEELSPSPDEPRQGWFLPDDDVLMRWMEHQGFGSFEEYVEALKKAERAVAK